MSDRRGEHRGWPRRPATRRGPAARPGPVGGDPGRAPRPARAWRSAPNRVTSWSRSARSTWPRWSRWRSATACASWDWTSVGTRWASGSSTTRCSPWCCVARPTRLRCVTSRSAGTSTRERPVRGGSALPRRRGGRHRRGAQRGQLQRVHDVGALSATGGHIRVLHGPGLTDMLGEMSAMSDERVLIHAGRLIDVERSEVLADRVIVIDGDRITDVLTEAPVESSAVTIDLSGHTVLPGLMDMHAHMIGEMENGQGYAGLVMRTAAQEAMTGIRNARATVEAGFTTVRDVGHVPGVRRLRAARRDRRRRHPRAADDVRRRVRDGLGRRRRCHRSRSRRRRRGADRSAVRRVEHRG